MIWPFKRKSETKKPVSRRGIFLWALAISAIAGGIQLFEPLEDLYRGGRNVVRARPADQKTVLVAIDNATVRRFGNSYYSRKYNAELIDKLFAMGVKRVYFDEAFSQPMDLEGDDAFAAALARHKGKVGIGGIAFKSRQAQSKGPVDWVPIEKFSANAMIRSVRSDRSPFSLSIEIYYDDLIRGKRYPTMSADIANVDGPIDVRYRPDWAIQVDTIPTVSLPDVLDQKVAATALAGKDVVVGVTSDDSPDFANVAGQGWFPGAYAHIVGSQTLREGKPISVGWIPAFLASGLFSFLLLYVRNRKQVAIGAACAIVIGLSAPLLLDSLFVTAEFLPAYLLFGIVGYRAATLRQLTDARLKNAGTLMPNLAALREEPLATQRPIIALRIRNYSAVCASFANSVEDDLVTELARRLTLPGQAPTFYQAEDVLYWLGPQLTMVELEEHLTGLAKLIESQFVIQGRKVDIHAAFGVDMDVSRSIFTRIGRALLAADEAAANHHLVQFNTSDNDDDREWELSLMGELDAAIDAGDIWIAFQPQFDLQNDQICGAEALVRWQHPTRGAISPEAFILPAEAHNRIKRLTFHVLEKATRASRFVLNDRPDFRLGVNISAGLFELPELPDEIAAVLAKVSYPAANLTLEVTESATFGEHKMVAANLSSIQAMGIQLSIDDYGTGNATLEYMRSVPCQEIKIDRRFIEGLVKNQNDMLLVESTIELAHGMNRRVIAEGIEDPETLELLRGIGCDIAQGYYLAKPMRIEAMESLLGAARRIKAA
jgi:EAL domain-containing protein (putative c-di-GMP-specific phosphodiesterase class I)/CHASE2 domain-containing sensor protein